MPASLGTCVGGSSPGASTAGSSPGISTAGSSPARRRRARAMLASSGARICSRTSGASFMRSNAPTSICTTAIHSRRAARVSVSALALPPRPALASRAARSWACWPSFCPASTQVRYQSATVWVPTWIADICSRSSRVTRAPSAVIAPASYEYERVTMLRPS